MADTDTFRVYVVAYRSPGSGGFDWFYREADALSRYEKESAHQSEDYIVRYIGPVSVPRKGELSKADEITAWIDAHDEIWDFAWPDAREVS